ncbi:HIT-like domain protein [Kalmanozyma brasiliensis GHG001]|uniref:HIT-like domain protein n=1 Tax=Kalmanozyma brasiliensis (strain GHG001) TaxID=1365824 RepID=UPI002867FCB3|nr:HIT-like domain protein [Kalmanozyma brasiliensis GHG001]EST05326.2 HIT-like domain protein [Kalmanozyma brasiliensis GHG001]
MPSLFNSCFGRKEDPQSELLSSTDGYSGSMPPAGKRKVDDVNPAKCIFCNVSRDRFNIVLEDDKYICFSDRSPAAAVHLLVIPRTHIANVQSLTSRDTQLVREMQAVGNKALDRLADGSSPTERRFGFHIPPFRSVDHLHLHCLQLPFRSSLKSLKYRIAKPSSPDYYKGWSWFAEWKQTCALLDAGRKVKVSSC